MLKKSILVKITDDVMISKIEAFFERLYYIFKAIPHQLSAIHPIYKRLFYFTVHSQPSYLKYNEPSKKC